MLKPEYFYFEIYGINYYGESIKPGYFFQVPKIFVTRIHKRR